MQWREDTTFPSRGLRLRPVGKSSESLQMTAWVQKLPGLSTFFKNAAIHGEMWLVDCTGFALGLFQQ
jgi:hypothetical protein